jgi:hypothetical protein
MTRIALVAFAISLLACNGPPCEIGRRRCVLGPTMRIEMCLESGWVPDGDCTPPAGWIGQCVLDREQGAACWFRESADGV